MIKTLKRKTHHDDFLDIFHYVWRQDPFRIKKAESVPLSLNGAGFDIRLAHDLLFSDIKF